MLARSRAARRSSAPAAQALAPELVHDLALGENDAKVKAIAALVAAGDAGALPLLQALLDGEVQTAGETGAARQGRRRDRPCDRRKRSTPLPETRDDVVAQQPRAARARHGASRR